MKEEIVAVRAPRKRARRPAKEKAKQPAGVAIAAILEFFSATILFVIAGYVFTVGAVARIPEVGSVIASVFVALAGGMVAIGVGLLKGKAWARWIHVVLAALTLVSAVAGVVLRGPDTIKLILQAFWVLSGISLLSRSGAAHFAAKAES